MINYVNPYILSTNKDEIDVISTFKHFVIEYFSAHSLNGGNNLLLWLTTVTDALYWVGLKKESDVLEKWDDLQSQNLDTPVFSIFNNIVVNTINYVGSDDKVIAVAKQVLLNILSVYPEVKEDNSLAKYDLSIETKLDINVLFELIKNNSWLAYLALFTTITHMDIQYISLNRLVFAQGSNKWLA